MSESVVGNQALKELRRVAEAIPEDQLHMSVFYETAPCGTAACLAGWASVDPEIRRTTTISDFLDASIIDGQFVVHHEEAFTLAEFGEVFGIDGDGDDAGNLFGGQLVPGLCGAHSVSKAEVLWNIDELLAGRPALPYKATRRNVPKYAGDIVNDGFDPAFDADGDPRD